MLLSTKVRIRESNFELLRIIAMFMILILHADFIALGVPGKEDFLSSPITSIIKILLEELCIVAVNVFVLLSGWFRIKPSVKGFCKFVYQCLFFSVGIFLFMFMSGRAEFSLREVAGCFFWTQADSYWFITSYICLYLFAPVLNIFIDNVDRSTYIKVLIAFFIFQTLYAFLGGGADFFMKGYSAMSFIGLYLLASFVRKFINSSVYSKSVYFIGYISISLISTAIFVFCIFTDFSFISDRFLAYSNPLVIFSSLCLLLFFSKLSFNNRFINSLSVSVFAVYLLHCNPHVFDLYIESIRAVVIKQTVNEYLLVLVIVCIWFLIAIIIDQLRIITWRLISECAKGH